MTYTKQTWADHNLAFPLSAARMNHIEEGINSIEKEGLYVNVKAEPFNAKGDGVTNDSAAIKAAITFLKPANGGTIYFPPGVYLLGETITVPNFVTFVGAAPGSSTIIRANGEFYCFTLNPANQAGIYNVWLDAKEEQKTVGGGVDYTKAGDNVVLQDVYLGNNLFTGLNIAPEVKHGDYRCARVRADGVTGVTNGIVIGDAVHEMSGITLDTCSLTAATATSIKKPLTINNLVDSVYIFDLEIYRGGEVKIGTEEAGVGVTALKWFGGFVDATTATYAVNVLKCEEVQFFGVGIDGTIGNGLKIGTEARGFRFMGGSVRVCTKAGITMAVGCLYTKISHCLIADNNTANEAGNHGISIGAATTDFSINDNEIGNKFGAFIEGFQKIGVNIAAGASNRYLVRNNRFFKNVESDFSDAGTGEEKSTTPNLIEGQSLTTYVEPKTVRETAKAFEPSKQRRTLVLLTIETLTAKRTLVEALVGGTVVQEAEASVAATGNTFLSMSFIVPPAKKWELKVKEGTVEKLWSSYLFF